MSRRQKRGKGPPSKGQNSHAKQNSPQKPGGGQNVASRATSEPGVGSESKSIFVAENPHQTKGLVPVPSVITPRRQIYRKQMHQKTAGNVKKKYGLVFFETPQSAKADLATLRDLASQCGQLNIVIRAEWLADDPELSSIGKVFAGAAWALIHERRKQDGWYDEQHE